MATNSSGRRRTSVALFTSLAACLFGTSKGFRPTPSSVLGPRHHLSTHSSVGENPLRLSPDGVDHDAGAAPTRRGFLSTAASSALATVLAGSSSLLLPAPSHAEGTKSTFDAAITDKIFIEFKGLSAPSADGSASPDRITIGLFGKDAPQPVGILKQLVTKEGYKSKCKPLDTSRTFQKEQLEANKVYNSCLENEDTAGVNYDYSTVWRVVKDERIDVGAVSGRFVARENPTFADANSGLRHDAAGVVSVRRGDEGGYSFVIYPGGGSAAALDEDNVVVGRVVEGMNIVEKLNGMPVVKNAGAKLAGGGKAKAAPSRGCRYGGSEYFCSEDKPLKKVLLDRFGVL